MNITLRVPHTIHSRAIQARNDLNIVATTLTSTTTSAALNTAEQALKRVQDNARQLRSDIRSLKRIAQEEARHTAKERRMADIGKAVLV